MKLFIDSSAFIALADSTDQDHPAAARFLRECPPETQFHTSSHVFSETVTRLRRTAGHRAALRWGKATLESRQTVRHYVDQELEREALRIFERYHDHPLSFVDCTTFVLLQRLGADRIFTFDRDFQRLGYLLVPGL